MAAQFPRINRTLNKVVRPAPNVAEIKPLPFPASRNLSISSDTPIEKGVEAIRDLTYRIHQLTDAWDAERAAMWRAIRTRHPRPREAYKHARNAAAIRHDIETLEARRALHNQALTGDPFPRGNRRLV